MIDIHNLKDERGTSVSHTGEVSDQKEAVWSNNRASRNQEKEDSEGIGRGILPDFDPVKGGKFSCGDGGWSMRRTDKSKLPSITKMLPTIIGSE